LVVSPTLLHTINLSGNCCQVQIDHFYYSSSLLTLFYKGYGCPVQITGA
jgi:hypothetical protein